MNNEPKVYILHENSAWVEPLRIELSEKGIPFEEWFLSEGTVDLNAIPPEGVFYNRMSASSHTRDHRYAVELTESIIAWLERHGRRVVNDRRAIQLEVRKSEQYLELNKVGVKTPDTIATVGKQQLLDAAEKFRGRPFITKPNRGGKGLGVQLFRTPEALQDHVQKLEFDFETIGGVMLLQEYIQPCEPFITRLEFVGGQFYYAVRVDTSGGFELCPADSCQVGEDFCPTTSTQHKFELVPDYNIPEIPLLEAFLERNGIEIGAVEVVENAEGERFFYDVNINTNYNSEAEARNADKVKGMRQIASFLGGELEKLKATALVTSNPAYLPAEAIEWNGWSAN